MFLAFDTISLYDRPALLDTWVIAYRIATSGRVVDPDRWSATRLLQWVASQVAGAALSHSLCHRLHRSCPTADCIPAGCSGAGRDAPFLRLNQHSFLRIK